MAFPMPETGGKRDAQERADKLRVFREQLTELEREQILVRSSFTGPIGIRKPKSPGRRGCSRLSLF